MKRLVFLFLLIPFFCHAGLLDNLQAYYTFNINGSDTSGNSKNGTVYGATVVSGLVGNALDFDGSNDRIIFSNANSVDCGSAMTISCWVKTTASGNPDAIYVRDNSSYKVLFPYFAGLGKNLQGYVRTTSGVSWGSFGGSGSIKDGNWHHYVMTYDKSLSSERVKIYQDTYLVGTADGFNEDITAGTSDSYIGYWAENWFDGILDEFGIWNVALTTNQIDSLFNYGNGLEYPFNGGLTPPTKLARLDSLKHAFPFSESAVDCVGSDNGTVSNCYLVVGISDSAYQFQTTGKINYNSKLDIEDFDFTISLWFRKNIIDDGLFLFGSDLLSRYSAIQVSVGLDSLIYLQWGDFTGSGSTDRRTFQVQDVVVDDLDWHHLVIKLLHQDRFVCFYDGVEKIVDYSSGTASIISFSATYYNGLSTSADYTGIIDELFIWDRQVTDEAIVDSLWVNGDGWFPYTMNGDAIDSFAIKINGRDLSTISKINGRSIDTYYKRNGRLIRKQ